MAMNKGYDYGNKLYKFNSHPERVSWISAIKRAFEISSQTQVKWVRCSGSKFHVSSPARCTTQQQFQFLRGLQVS